MGYDFKDYKGTIAAMPGMPTSHQVIDAATFTNSGQPPEVDVARRLIAAHLTVFFGAQRNAKLFNMSDADKVPPFDGDNNPVTALKSAAIDETAARHAIGDISEAYRAVGYTPQDAHNQAESDYTAISNTVIDLIGLKEVRDAHHKRFFTGGGRPAEIAVKIAENLGQPLAAARLLNEIAKDEGRV